MKTDGLKKEAIFFELTRIQPVETSGIVKALVDISINSIVTIKGFKVVCENNTLSVRGPIMKNGSDGTFLASVLFSDKKIEQLLSNVVLASYSKP